MYFKGFNLTLIITDKSIRDRFILCFHEVPGTIKEKAAKLKVNEKYISQLPKKKNPQIKGSLIANFCITFDYSPYFILLDIGSKKIDKPVTGLETMFKSILKAVNRIEKKDTQIIYNLLEGLIELKATWNEAHQKLVDEGKKRIKN